MRIISTVLAMLCIVSVEDASAQSRMRKGRVRRPCNVVTPTPDRVGIFTAGALEGRLLGDLYAGYTGVRGRTPAQVRVDPGRQLDSLWRVKLSCNRRNPVAVQLHLSLLGEYRERRTHLTLREFANTAEHEVRFVQTAIRWSEVARMYRLKPRELSTLESLAVKLSGTDLAAYGMTEIMPSADGVLNMQVLEFLVRNHGPEFMYSVPAVHDRYASFGFYQLTSFAVYDDGRRIEGASRMSRALRTGNLPGSTVMIRKTLQHRAAYLFALHNIAVLVKGLNARQLGLLRNLPPSKHSALVQFIAAAHNGPAHARSAAKRWLDNGMRSEYYISVANRAVRKYAYKTKKNLEALRSRGLDGELYGSR